MVETGQHGKPEWFAGAQSYSTVYTVQHAIMHCVFWHPSIKASIKFFGNLWYSIFSVGSRFTLHIEHWVSRVFQWFCSRPLLVGWIQETGFGVALNPVQQSLPIVPTVVPTNQLRELPFVLLPDISHSFNRCHWNEIINVIHITCQWFKVMADRRMSSEWKHMLAFVLPTW